MGQESIDAKEFFFNASEEAQIETPTARIYTAGPLEEEVRCLRAFFGEGHGAAFQDFTAISLNYFHLVK